jgi:hypothetical protein
MTYIPFEYDFDPGFRYEGLARYAFDCKSYGGPNNVAHQAVYNALFVPEVNEEGVIVLGQILDALIAKTEGDKKAEFIDLKASLSDNMKQMTAIELIDYIIQIIKN